MTDIHQVPINQFKPNIDCFSFDDLLVSCAHEIMVNGIQTEIVPDTIKDWLCGKLVRALPGRLTQKLLSFLLDNRDLEGILDFREETIFFWEEENYFFL